MTATDGPAQDRRPGAVLVTGGASGLGAAVALAVRDAGGRPFVLDLVNPPFEVDHELVDLADRRAAAGAVDRAAQRLGRLDGVVTAAGVDACGPLGSVPADAWERVVAVNLLGTAAGLYCSGRPSKKAVCMPPGISRVTPTRPAVSAARALVKPTTPNLLAQ